MNWFKIHFSGVGKQRQQREESLSRLSESRMKQLESATTEHTAAVESVTKAVEEQRDQSMALRGVLNTVVRRMRARQQTASLRRGLG